ncbi:MAG: DHHA1 domain-containing protein [Calditrichia bacterium]
MEKKIINKNTYDFQKELEQFDRLMSGAGHLLIVVHNNPDPDAIASAAALGYIAEKRCQIATSLAYGGTIVREENRAMVKKLKIHLKQIHRIHFEKYDRIAVVDTQPGAGNHSLPPDVQCHLVIDHHPREKTTRADLVIVQPEAGATATILVEWLQQSNLDIPTALATALAYAISSETQNLGRETSQRDIQAYLAVYVKSSIRTLAQITLPKLRHSFFVMLARALQNAVIYRNLILAHLGPVPNPEIVPEMTDFLLRHQRIGWSLCTGRFRGQLIISLRTSKTGAKAGEFVRKLVSKSHTVGGHDQIAGGYVPLNNMSRKELLELQEKLTHEFATLHGYEKAEWQPLLKSKGLHRKSKLS